MEDILKSGKETIVHQVETPHELDRFVNGTYDQNDLLVDEPLTNFAVFDSMSAEMIQISRYPFLLEWQNSLKGLVINPLTLALVSRWRLFLNLALLFISLYLSRIVPSNSMVQYFLGASSPIYYGIWIPYFILLIVDAKYLSRLYLLISEMSRRSKTENSKQKVVLLDPSLILSKDVYNAFQHTIRRQGAHLVRFTDKRDSSDCADIVFSIPKQSEKQLLKYMGVLSGLNVSESSPDESINEAIEFQPIEANILEAFIHSNLLKTYSPRTCHKLVVNYEYMAERFTLTHSEKEQVAEILLIKYAESETEKSIGFESNSSELNETEIYSRIQSYL